MVLLRDATVVKAVELVLLTVLHDDNDTEVTLLAVAETDRSNVKSAGSMIRLAGSVVASLGNMSLIRGRGMMVGIVNIDGASAVTFPVDWLVEMFMDEVVVSVAVVLTTGAKCKPWDN